MQVDLVKSPRKSRNARYEERLAFEIRAARLPEPVPQYRWATELVNANGRPRQFRADFAWPTYRLLVQVHGAIWQRGGGGHSHPSGIEKDVEQQRCAVILGWWVYPVTSTEVQAGKAIGLVTLALAARGWTR